VVAVGELAGGLGTPPRHPHPPLAQLDVGALGHRAGGEREVARGGRLAPRLPQAADRGVRLPR
jgi:hypothetical protein